MADIEIGYKGSTITSINSGGVTTLNTIGTFCEDNITVTFNKTQGEAFTPATTITTNPSITLSATTGTITAFYSGASNITPTVTPGYVSAGTAGTVKTSGTSTYQLSTVAAQTITPTTASQLAVASGRFTTGNIYVGAIPIPVFDVTWDNDWSDIIAVSCNMTYSECLDLCNNGDLRAMARVHDLAETEVAYLGATSYREGGNTDVKYVVTATGGSPELDISYHQNDTLSFNYPSSKIIDVTPTATKGAVSNNAINVTPSVPIPKGGFVSRGTRTGSPVTVSASELVSGTLSITSNGTYDVTEYASVSTNIPEAERFAPIYKNLAFRSALYASGSDRASYGSYTASDISDWCDSLSRINQDQFVDQLFFGSYVFNYVTTISQRAFAYIKVGGTTTMAHTLTFPLCSFVSGYAFYGHMGGYINLPSCTVVQNNAFTSCQISGIHLPLVSSLGTVFDYCSCPEFDLPEVLTVGDSCFGYCSTNSIYLSSCISISSNAFYSCKATTIEIPNCENIGRYAFYSCASLKSINCPKIVQLPLYTFGYCTRLESAYFENCEIIEDNTFFSCVSLTAISFPKCTTIGSGAFAYCKKLSSIYFPVCTTIGRNAFANCSSLTTANFPSCTTIGYSAFTNCSLLSIASFPACTTISNYVFDYCSSLTTANFPSCTTIGYSAFAYCASLTTISFPVCTTIGTSAFAYCSSLTTANLPSCTTINSYVFYNCASLTTVSLPMCTSIYGRAFWGCYNLISLYLLGSSVVDLRSYDTFSSTPISNYTTSTGGVYGSIFVRASLYNSYLTATHWSYFSSRFVSLTDAEIEALGS